MGVTELFLCNADMLSLQDGESSNDNHYADVSTDKLHTKQPEMVGNLSDADD